MSRVQIVRLESELRKERLKSGNIEMRLKYALEHIDSLQEQLKEIGESADEWKKKVQESEKHSAMMGEEIAVMTCKIEASKPKKSFLGRVSKSRLSSSVGSLMLGSGAGAVLFYLAQKTVAGIT